VTALDGDPARLAAARAAGDAAGLPATWVAGPPADLPFGDAAFDVVVSAFGVQLAGDHETVARELARVLRPGGRLGLCAWSPGGLLGDVLRALAEHDGAPGDPLAWGRPDRVRRLLRPAGMRVGFVREAVRLRCASVPAAVDGCLAALGRSPGVDDAPARALAGLFGAAGVAAGGAVDAPAAYLVVLGRRRA
jgi:SAM-dependent methyltransferase